MKDKIFNLYSTWKKEGIKKPLLTYLQESTGNTQAEVERYLNILKREGKIQSVIKEQITSNPVKTKKKLTIRKLVKKHVSKITKANWIKYIMYFLFVSCLITSVKYSYAWRVDEISPFWAILTSFTMVLYGAIGFSVIRKYGLTGVIKWICFLTSILVLVFSMAQTIAGQYKGFNKEETKIEMSGLVSLEKKLVRLNEKRLTVIRDINKNYEDKKVFDDFEKIAWYKTRYNTLVAEEKTLKSELEEVEDHITNTENEIENYKKDNITTVKADFFMWLCSTMFKNANVEVVRFWFYLFPAIFVDIMGPTALYIGMIGKTVKKDKNK